jgi:hypothetical protein
VAMVTHSRGVVTVHFPFDETFQAWPRGLINAPEMFVRTGQIWPR